MRNLSHLLNSTSMLHAAPNDAGSAEIIDNIQAYRDAFKASEGRDIDLTDEIISSIVLATDDDMEPEAWVALFKAGEAKSDETGVTAIQGKATAINLSREIDEEFLKEIDSCLAATRKKKMMGIDIAHQLERVHIKRDAKGKVIRDGLANAPFPGTDKDDCGNREPDNYTTKDRSTDKVIHGSWWNDYADNSPRGIIAVNGINDIKKAKNNSKDAKKEYVSMDEDQLDQLTAGFTADRNALRNMFKEGAKVHFQMERINDMEKVGVRFITKADGVTLLRGPKPLWLYSKSDNSKGKVISVTQLNNLKPGNVGPSATRAELWETVGRDSDPAENGAIIKTVEEADEAFADLTAFLNERTNQAALLKELAGPVADSGDTRASVCALYVQLKPIYLKYQAWYEKYLLDGLDAEDKDTKAA